MTAVVGILNKHAIALAADSAVTIGSSNGRKIFNKANKVFALSKFHPIGVMIFNAASFMETPWETIIKIYRKEIKEKAFATLLEYQHDFINFLKDKKYFADEVVQANFLESFASEIINSIVREIVNQNKQLIENPTIENQGSLQLILERHLDILIEKWGAKANPCEDFSGYTFESFMSYSNQIFEKIFHIIFVVNNFIPSEAVLSKIKYLVYHILISKEDKTSYTGLIFCGFGEEEIYPQLISLNISIVVDHRLRF